MDKYRKVGTVIANKKVFFERKSKKLKEVIMFIRKFHNLKDTDFFNNSPWFKNFSSEDVWNPAVDISETKELIVIKVEVPGVEKNALNITLLDDVITISGEKKFEKSVEGTDSLLKERSYGRFQRSFRLTTEIDSSNIKANFKDGILILELPKSEKSKPKEIKIDLQ